MQKRLFTLFFLSFLFVGFIPNYAQVSSQIIFTPEQQDIIDSLILDYTTKGIDLSVATERAESIVVNEIIPPSRSRLTQPPNNSIWIDRDTSNWANYHPVYHAYTEEDLVKKVLLADPAAEDAILAVRFTGVWSSTTRSLAYFENGYGLGIPSGLLLGTGNILLAEGPNPRNAQLSGGSTTVANDYHLNQISTGLTAGSRLEFDFKPYADKVTFDFIFASEEYPQYSNSNFNDVFGFFVYEQGDPTNYTNIALFPNGDAVTINNSNWGKITGSSNTPTGLPAPRVDAVNPQWHIPNYIDNYIGSDSIMEYDGRTVKLTAAAFNLDTTKVYTLKLVICNVSDTGYGSGVFLSNLDLGSPQGSIETDFDNDGGPGWNAAWDDAAIARNDFYAGCTQTISFEVIPSNRDRYMHFDFAPSFMKDYMIVDGGSFVDSVFVASRSDSPVSMSFTVAEIPEDLNGVPFFIFSYYVDAMSGVAGTDKDTTVLTFYNHPTYDVKYSRPTIGYAGKLELNISGGTPYLMRSLNKGNSWFLATNPISGSEIYNLQEEEEPYIWLKEPNSCWSQVINLIENDIPPEILRPVTMPEISGAIVSVTSGEKYVLSGENFSFTIQPTGANAGKIPVITTNRITIPDSEGVKIEDLGKGVYRITILEIREPINIVVDFATDNELITGGDNVWTNKGQLYITTTTSGNAAIYNVAGDIIKIIPVVADETVSIVLPTGFYVVTMNGKVYKIVL